MEEGMPTAPLNLSNSPSTNILGNWVNKCSSPVKHIHSTFSHSTWSRDQNIYEAKIQATTMSEILFYYHSGEHWTVKNCGRNGLLTLMLMLIIFYKMLSLLWNCIYMTMLWSLNVLMPNWPIFPASDHNYRQTLFFASRTINVCGPQQCPVLFAKL